MLTKSVLVKKEKSQLLRRLLDERKSLDHTRRLMKVDETHIAIPVLCDLDLVHEGHGQLDGVPFESVDHLELPSSGKTLQLTPTERLKRDVKTYVETTGQQWTVEMESDLPAKWDRHGDMVVLPGYSFTEDIWRNLGSDLWQAVCKSLGSKRLAKTSSVTNNAFRSPQVALLAGDNTLVTHKDNGILYEFDLAKCMFSTGNITEKLRVASFNCRGQTVVDLFAGIGYFTLPYLVHAGAARVFACEWNPDAVDALRRNLTLNRVAERCTVLPGDNREVSPRDVADRVNLGLIPTSVGSWEVACRALRPETGGVLHIHANVEDTYGSGSSGGGESGTEQLARTNQTLDVDVNCKESQQNNSGDLRKSAAFQKKSRRKPSWAAWAEDTSRRIREISCCVRDQEWTTRVLHIEHVKSYAPHVDHIVLDLECRPAEINSL